MFRKLFLIPAFMLCGCNGHSGAYLIEPVPELSSLSSTPSVYLAPFSDRRSPFTNCRRSPWPPMEPLLEVLNNTARR